MSGPVSYKSNLEDLGAAILAYARVYTKKDLPEILEDQANKLSCNNFGVDQQGLFQESAATAPTNAQLEALPPAVNWRIKRASGPIFTTGYYRFSRIKRGERAGQLRTRKKDGRLIARLVGQEGEINKRERHRYFQAAGWLSSRLGKYGRGAASLASQRPDRAQVVLVLTGSVLSISITNTSPAALEVALRTGYLARAIVNRKKDLDTYTQRKLDERTAQFNQTRLPAPH